MKVGVCTLLVLTQVLLSTLGQGALSLCVRTDGTEKVQWTFSKACSKKYDDQKVCSCCGAKKKSESSSANAVKQQCHSCEDFVILAETESTTTIAHHLMWDEFSKLSLNVANEWLSSIAPVQIIAEIDSSPVLPDSLSTIVSTVVIRC